VVNPFKLTTLFDRSDIVGLFNNTNEALITAWVRAVVAGIYIGNVAAHRAIRNSVLNLTKRFAKLLHLTARVLKEVKRQSLRTPGTDTR
jgi:hypothetical protein